MIRLYSWSYRQFLVGMHSENIPPRNTNYLFICSSVHCIRKTFNVSKKNVQRTMPILSTYTQFQYAQQRKYSTMYSEVSSLELLSIFRLLTLSTF